MTASLFIMSKIIVDLGNAFPEPLTMTVADFDVWKPAEEDARNVRTLDTLVRGSVEYLIIESVIRVPKKINGNANSLLTTGFFDARLSPSALLAYQSTIFAEVNGQTVGEAMETALRKKDVQHLKDTFALFFQRTI